MTLGRGSFRRRLALAFVAVAALSSGALAVGAGAAVTSYRHRSFADRAREEVRQELRLIDAGAPSEAVAAEVGEDDAPGDPAVVVHRDGTEASSARALHLRDVPLSLRRRVAADAELPSASVTVEGEPFLVVGTGSKGGELYFFFARDELLRGLRDLRNGLAIGWFVVTTLAGLVGDLFARRTLRPVREAADAARSVTEGALDTRLAASGSDEFAALAASFNEMVVALDARLADLAAARDREQRFNADIAHELRTPLGSLVTAASLLDESAARLPEELRRPAALVLDGARRLRRLVDDLLELHRLELGHGSPMLEVVDVDHAVRRCIAAHGWEGEVTVHSGGREPIETDPVRLDRILVNLVANALQHGGGTAHVEVRRSGDEVVVAVYDEGPGIPREDIPHLFDRYFKVSRSRTAGDGRGGSGLGLAIVAENARLLGMTVDVASEAGRGSRFELRIPLLRRDEPSMPEPPRGPSPPGASAAVGSATP